ncbi:MAG: response regulator transcription factor [Candidatus Delongbacteria bacterium]
MKILLAEDHKLLRDTLAPALQARFPGCHVLEAADGRAALHQVREHQPELILMDISMPGLNGLDAARQILAEFPVSRIVFLSMHSDRRYVQAAFAAGARGYLSKDAPLEEVTRLLAEALAGRRVVSRELEGLLLEDYSELARDRHGVPAAGSSRLDRLSSREREVLQRLAEGAGTRQIAESLHLSPKTVETHRAQLMEKLGLHSVAELTKLAIREGLTRLE